MAKLILSILIVSSFYSGFWVCKFVHPRAFGEDFIQSEVDRFTDLRYSIYAFILFLVMIRSNIKGKVLKLDEYVCVVGLLLSIADVIDRYYFNITSYDKDDLGMFISSLVTAYIEVYTRFGIKNMFEKYKLKYEKSRLKF